MSVPYRFFVSKLLPTDGWEHFEPPVTDSPLECTLTYYKKSVKREYSRRNASGKKLEKVYYSKTFSASSGIASAKPAASRAQGLIPAPAVIKGDDYDKIACRVIGIPLCRH